MQLWRRVIIVTTPTLLVIRWRSGRQQPDPRGDRTVAAPLVQRARAQTDPLPSCPGSHHAGCLAAAVAASAAVAVAATRDDDSLTCCCCCLAADDVGDGREMMLMTRRMTTMTRTMINTRTCCWRWRQPWQCRWRKLRQLLCYSCCCRPSGTLRRWDEIWVR